jgi:ADP-ribose pyrophosphatase YjhB (NUDIX family)
MISQTEPHIAKVTAFVTRRQNDVELLVFQHPTAGMQLPAGTIDEGETPLQAVVREVFEETGLTSLGSVTSLGLISAMGQRSDRMILDTTPFYVEPNVQAETILILIGTGIETSTLRRGYWCELVGDEADWSCIAYNYTSVVDGIRTSRCKLGWVPSHYLAADVTREMFHVPVTAATPDRWIHSCEGDGLHGIEVFWTPLNAAVELVESNRRWLEFAREALEALV